MRTIKAISLLALLLIISACTKSSDDVDFGNGGSGGSVGNISGDFRTNCGTVVGGNLRNPPSTDDGEQVRVISTAGVDSVIVERDGGPQLIKFRALSPNLNNFVATRARSIIDDFSGSAVLYTDDCTVFFGGGAGSVGEIFNTRGESLTERLIEEGAALIDGTGSCQENLVASCYQALAESSTPPTGDTVSNFLWKPQAERDGNLVVLLNPGGATIVVNGETLADSGPSNGRGTTARGNRSGGAYGSNIKVEAFDSSGRALVFPGGLPYVIIANGSQRVEIP